MPALTRGRKVKGPLKAMVHPAAVTKRHQPARAARPGPAPDVRRRPARRPCRHQPPPGGRSPTRQPQPSTRRHSACPTVPTAGRIGHHGPAPDPHCPGRCIGSGRLRPASRTVLMPAHRWRPGRARCPRSCLPVRLLGRGGPPRRGCRVCRGGARVLRARRAAGNSNTPRRSRG